MDVWLEQAVRHQTMAALCPGAPTVTSVGVSVEPTTTDGREWDPPEGSRFKSAYQQVDPAKFLAAKGWRILGVTATPTTCACDPSELQVGRRCERNVGEDKEGVGRIATATSFCQLGGSEKPNIVRSWRNYSGGRSWRMNLSTTRTVFGTTIGPGILSCGYLHILLARKRVIFSDGRRRSSYGTRGYPSTERVGNTGWAAK